MVDKIALVIVTYNRKELLINCLEAVLEQTLKPQYVLITDNASTDGTKDYLAEKGYYNCITGNTLISYLNTNKNVGSAGGFYCGMKTAMEKWNPDAIWVMDDDGKAEKDCLKELAKYIGKYDYVAPLVLSIDDDTKLAFDCYGEIKIKNVINKYECDGLIQDFSCPYNGILYSKSLIDAIGYPKPDMFIWGDENNYHYRAKKMGYIPVTVLAAIHRHPQDRQIKVNGPLGSQVIVFNQKWKLFCFIRNKVYNSFIKYNMINACYQIMKLYIKYSIFYLNNGNYVYFKIMNKAFYKGLISDFSGMEQYF